MTAAIPRLWKDGYKQMSGLEEAIFKNCEAATQLGEVVRTSFGPNGLSKIVINRIEKVYITTDAATIINELEVQHPAAKVLCLAAAMQQREIGDGANFVVVFAGELLKKSLGLLRIGLHPSDLVRGYTMAEKKCQEILRTLTVYEASKDDLKNKDKLMMGVRSAISSKQYGSEDFLSELVAKACMNSMPENVNNFIVDNLRTVKILGGSVSDSFVIKGMVIETSPKSICQFKENTNVAIFTCAFESTQTETKGTVLLHNAEELLNYNKSEEDYLHKVVKNLHDMGVGVMICGDKISEMALHFLDKYQIVCIKLISKWTLRRLCRATRSRPLVGLNNVTPTDLGRCAQLYTKEIGADTVTVFAQVGLGESEVSTILIRGATQTVLSDVERAIDDGVNMVRAMTKNGKFVAGAGACEIEIARQLAKWGANTPGLEQYAIQMYAEALEIVPRTLAENTGLNDSEIISKLYKAHETGESVTKKRESKEEDSDYEDDDPTVETSFDESKSNKSSSKYDPKIESKNSNYGVDIINGGVKDVTIEGVIDLMATRQMGIKLATQGATTILRVDHIIMKKPSGGPRKPNRGHWDDNDETW